MKTFAVVLDRLFVVLPADVWADKDAMIHDSELIVGEARRRRGQLAAMWLQARIISNLLLTAVVARLSVLPDLRRGFRMILRETRYAFRRLRRGRSLTLVTAGVCAVSIAASIAVGALTSTLLLGLDTGGVRKADQVVSLQWGPPGGAASTEVDYQGFAMIRDRHVGALAAVTASAYASATCSCAPVDKPVHVGLVSDGFFEMLGVRPYLGRVPTDLEDDGAVLSYATWQSAFAGSSAVLGAPILMNAHRFTVFGVAPQDFAGPHFGVQPAVWVSLAAQPLLLRPPQYLRKKFPDLLHVPGYSWLRLWASLAPSAKAEAASEQLRTILPDFPFSGQRLIAIPFRDARVPPELRGVATRFLVALSAAVFFLLALAATALMQNSALRSEQTIPEVAARLSLGAPASLPLLLPFIDTAVVVLASGVIGVCLAPFMLRTLFLAFPPLAVPVSISISSATWITGLLMVGVLLVLALIPPVYSSVRSYRSRNQLLNILRGYRHSSPRGIQRIGSIAVLVQVTTATAFVGAVLVMAELAVSLNATSLGFNPDRLVVADLNLDQFDLTDTQGIAMTQALHEVLRAVPGVRALTFAAEAPFSALSRHTLLDLDPRPRLGVTIDTNSVDADFFSVLQVPILRGDPPGALSATASGGTAVVNRRFVAVMSGLVADASKLPSSVVADVRYNSMFGVVVPLRYRPTRGEFEPNPEALIRLSDTSADTLDRIRRALAAVRPELQRTVIRRMDDNLAVASWLPRTLGRVLAVFAITVMLVSVAGTFAVVAFVGECRRHEYAIRTALGATSWHSIAVSVGALGVWIFAGCLVGAVLVWRTSPFLQAAVGAESQARLWVSLVAAVATGLSSCLAGWWGNAASRRLSLASLLNAS